VFSSNAGIDAVGGLHLRRVEPWGSRRKHQRRRHRIRRRGRGRADGEPATDKVNDPQPEGGTRLEDVALGGAATSLGGAARGGGQPEVGRREVEEEQRLRAVR
jgi:hypothetical protein